MNLTELTIRPGTLTEVKKKSSGGRMGQLYFLKNENHEELVVKFQSLQRTYEKDRPAKAVIETAILEAVGASAPKARRATPVDRRIILEAVENSKADKETKESFESDNRNYQFMVLMELVEGDSVAELQKSPEGALKFLTFIQDDNFQVELGRILAADLFAGNPDRMFIHASRDFNPNQPNAEALVAFFNTGNLIVREERGIPKPIAIDNQFGFQDTNLHMATREFVIKQAGPWGYRDLGTSIPSLALAVGELARQETGLLFEHFLAGAKKAGVAPEEIDLVRNKSKAKFQQRVAEAANQALTSLLKGGGKWLHGYKCFEPEQKSAFKQHKRLLRQLMAEETEAVTPEMIETAVENTKYKQWVLKREDKLNDEYVDDLLQKDSIEYKKFIRGHEGKVGDDDDQQNLEKEKVRAEMRRWVNFRNKEQIGARLKELGQRVAHFKEQSNLPDSSGSNQTSTQAGRWVPLKKQPGIGAKKQPFIGAKKGN